MPLQSAQKKSKQKAIIYLTFFLLLSIPLVLFGIAQENFDIRRRAFQDLQLSDEYQCLISFPHVNPYSLEEGSTVIIQVEGRIKDDYARELEIYDTNGNVIHSEVFDIPKTEFETHFTYTPKISGKADMSGFVTKGQGGVVECQITSPFNIHGLQVVPENTAPEFLSRPSESVPSQNIQTADMYEYTLTASDIDGDNINYSYSFTPRADWLRPTVIEDGAGGNLTIKFKGSTNKAASYLAHVLIHDGYSKNVRSQSWVINVSPKENDIPVVTIIDPIESLRIDRGVTFRTSWESTDLNQIIGHELFITNNPTNEDTWITIEKDIPYNQNSYNVNSSDINPGTYKLIVRSTDNQDPSASGIGISPEVVISTVTDRDEDERDDEVVLTQPQIVNVSPSSTDDVKNRLVTVRATLIAGQGTTINENTISFKINDTNLTENIRINKISETEYTIIYQPETELDEGVNKVEISFKDSQEQEASRSWNFMIESDKDTEEDILLIFGYEVPRNVIMIVGIGLITVIMALAIPFIIFSIWKGDKRRDDSQPYQNDKLPPSTPKDNTQYIEVGTEEPDHLKDKVKTKKEVYGEKEKEEDVWDMYSAPKPDDLPEDLNEEIVEEEVILDIPVDSQITPEIEQEQQIIDVADEKEEEVQESIIDEQLIPVDSQITPEIKQEQQIIDVIDEKEEPAPTPTPTPPPQTPQPEIIDIPEPEIPDAKDLENIFNQIQQQKAEDKQQEDKEQTEVVKE